jgi:hypothetical protein
MSRASLQTELCHHTCCLVSDILLVVRSAYHVPFLQ